MEKPQQNVQKNGSMNDRPLFMQNGKRRFSTNEVDDIGEFRRAFPQFLAVSVKNILLFGYGMTLGFPTIVIPAIQGGDGRETSDIVLTKEQISWFSSINLICVPLGCLFSGILTQPIGKRRAMQIVNLPILASWVLFHFATKTEHLYAALFLSGLGGGLLEAPVLTYVAEISEPKYRGILAALGSTCVITGIFIQFIFGSLMDWRSVAAVSSVFPIICIIALCFVPESPHWLIREERFREAVKALQWLRGWVPEHKIEEEFNRLYDEIITKPALEEAAEKANGHTSKCYHFTRMCTKRSVVVPFLLVAFTFLIGHFSGKTTLQTYAVQIFSTLKAPINKYHATILLGVVEMIATILCVGLIHFTGKRPLVLISTAGVGICWFCAATYAHHLNIVPGFAVDNVVANASQIFPKENIISQHNITHLFKNEKNALLMQLTETPIDDTTMFAVIDDVDFTTFPTNSNESLVRYQRDTETNNETFLIFDNSAEKQNKIGSINLTSFELNDSDEIEINKETKPDYQFNDEDTTIMTALLEDDKLSKKNVQNPTTTTPNKIIPKILLPVPEQEHNDLLWLPLIMLLGAAFFAHIGIRLIPWILIGEVFPAAVRSTASGMVGGFGYIFGFLANKLFLQMIAALTLPGTFWFYSMVSFIGGVVLYFVLPETEGKTLGEIEAHFSKKSDTNLLKKSPKCHKNSIQLDNLQQVQIPISSQLDAKIIKLKQSDLLPNQQQRVGAINSAFEKNSTTHL